MWYQNKNNQLNKITSVTEGNIISHKFFTTKVLVNMKIQQCRTWIFQFFWNSFWLLTYHNDPNVSH